MSARSERIKILTGGIFSLVLAMGVARFSYTPLLPLMQRQAGLGITEAGLLAAINYAGYLSGAIAASMISSQKLKVRLYIIGLAVAVLTTAMMGMSESVWVWAISRYFAGLSTAAAMLMGSGLILNWLMRHQHRSELGIHFSGVGIGIAVCSAAVALMNPELNWREQWYAFTALGVLLAIPALVWLPDTGHASAGTGRRSPSRQSALATFSACLHGVLLLRRDRLCGECDLHRVDHRRLAGHARPRHAGVLVDRRRRRTVLRPVGSDRPKNR